MSEQVVEITIKPNLDGELVNGHKRWMWQMFGHQATVHEGSADTIPEVCRSIAADLGVNLSPSHSPSLEEIRKAVNQAVAENAYFGYDLDPDSVANGFADDVLAHLQQHTQTTEPDAPPPR